ncbi:hypothetical protein ACRRTK_003860 [Alexandromys fortis]
MLSPYSSYLKSKVQDSWHLLIEMDYVEEKLSSEFAFNNPNITGTCGCGESFNI